VEGPVLVNLKTEGKLNFGLIGLWQCWPHRATLSSSSFVTVWFLASRRFYRSTNAIFVLAGPTRAVKWSLAQVLVKGKPKSGFSVHLIRSRLPASDLDVFRPNYKTNLVLIAGRRVGHNNIGSPIYDVEQYKRGWKDSP